MRLKIALFGGDPYPMQLPLEAVPQEHGRVFAHVCNVLLILACKELLLHALSKCAITAGPTVSITVLPMAMPMAFYCMAGQATWQGHRSAT